MMLSGGAIAGIVVGVILALVVGGFIGAFIAYKIFRKKLKENPPISKDTIRLIYNSCGRKPSEQQINTIFKQAMGENKK